MELKESSEEWKYRIVFTVSGSTDYSHQFKMRLFQQCCFSISRTKMIRLENVLQFSKVNNPTPNAKMITSQTPTDLFHFSQPIIAQQLGTNAVDNQLFHSTSSSSSSRMRPSFPEVFILQYRSQGKYQQRFVSSIKNL